MLLWQGDCIVHDEFKRKALVDMKAVYPDAEILVHPESPKDIVELADSVGSTSQLIQAGQKSDKETFIVATDRGIFYKMQQLMPNKTFIAAPTAGEGATCRSCAHCPWMAMNGLEAIYNALTTDILDKHEIFVDDSLRDGALIPLRRMLDFAAQLKLKIKGNA